MKFIVYGHHYHKKSNGVLIMWELAKQIISAGQNCIFVIDEQDSVLNMMKGYDASDVGLVPMFFLDRNFDPDSDIDESDIVIYTDVVPGNPLRAKKVVRYLMNIPYALTGEGVLYGYSDFVVSYSNLVDPSLQQLFLLKEDPLNYHTEEKDQGLVVVYLGKVNPKTLKANWKRAFEVIRRYKRVLFITRGSPATKSALHSLLARASLMISFDPLSNLNHEATIHGTPCLMLDDQYEIKKCNFNTPLKGFFFDPDKLKAAQVEVTQALPLYRAAVGAGNRQAVKGFVDDVLRHFNTLEQDPSYRKDRIAFINKLYQKDIERFSQREHIAFQNIDSEAALPEYILADIRSFMSYQDPQAIAYLGPSTAKPKSWSDGQVIRRSAGSLQNLNRLKAFHLELDFSVDLFTLHSNLFQTSKLNAGLRMEFFETPDRTLTATLIRGWGEVEYEFFSLEQGFDRGLWYHLSLDHRAGRTQLQIDGKTLVDVTLEKNEPLFDDIVVGSGFSPDRALWGQIKNIAVRFE